MAAKMELSMSRPTLATLPPVVHMLLFLIVVLIPVFLCFQSRKSFRPCKGQSKRYLEFEGFGPLEAIIERMAAMVTTFHGKAYRYILAHTRGATVISLLSKRIIMVYPSMERALGKYADSMSLAHSTRFFGNCMFDISADGIQRVTDYDSRSIHRSAFSGTTAVRELVEQATNFAQTRIDMEPGVQQTMLGAWLFKMVNTALITAIWGAVTVWMVRHLLSDQLTLRRVVSQVRSIDSASLDGGKMDVDHINRTCPMLVASAYETMRLHMTAVPRVAKQDFQVPVMDAASGSILRVKEGDLVVLPMASVNLDPAVWGSNVERFSPERFLARDGSVSEAAVRRLRVFGVAGNMCPGRKLGLSAILFVTATVLRTFDIEPAAGDVREARSPPPEASPELGIGLERVGGDVQATIRRINV